MMNKIVASRINLLAMSLNCGLPKRSSSHIDSELKYQAQFQRFLKADERGHYAFVETKGNAGKNVHYL